VEAEARLGCLRASRGAGVPAVGRPSAADQPAQRDDRVRERQERINDRAMAFGVPDQLFELVAPGVGALDRPPSAGLDRGRLALFGDLAGHAPLGQRLAGRAAVIAAVQVHRGPGGQQPQPIQGVQGGGQAAARRCGWPRRRPYPAGSRTRRLPPSVCGPVAAVDRATPGMVSAAGRLGDAPVYGQITQLQADHAVIGVQDQQLQGGKDARAIHWSRRSRMVVAEQVASAILR